MNDYGMKMQQLQGTLTPSVMYVEGIKERLDRQMMGLKEKVKKAEEFKEEDNKLRENIEARNGLENYLYNLKNSVLKEPENAEQKSPAFDEVKKEVEPFVEEGLKWLDEHTKEDTEVYKNKQKELEDKINPLMTKLYGASAQEAGPIPTGATTGSGPMPTVDEVD
jgi:L1 cell adhesion molecule like protein